AHLAARRRVARTRARRWAVHAGGDRAAVTARAGGIPAATVYRSVLPRGATVRGARLSRRSAVASGKRGNQFSRAPRLALPRPAHPRTLPRSNARLQGFRRAFHGSPDGLFRAQRDTR